MATKVERYWKKRNEELEKKWNTKSRETVEKEILAYYRQSLFHIQKEIQALYSTYATNNQMTIAQARKYLQGDEYRAWRMDIQEYIDRIHATGSKELLKELNTLAMRSRISRLDKLYSETLMEIGNLAGKTGRSMDKFLTDAYKDLYYRNLYEVGHAVGFKGMPSKVDSQEVEKVLRVPWSGKNYSQRIWKNDAKLAQTIQDTIVQGVHRGTSAGKLSSMVAKRMGVGMQDATRLVRTELNYIQNRAALDGIAEAGLEFFQFNATLDTRTTPMCRSHDGMVYPIEEASPGENMPPLHPRCRSTIFGCIDGGGRSGRGKRIARDADGKNIHVPANMKYEDWKAVYIDKSKTMADWQKANPVPAKSGIMDPKDKVAGFRSTLTDQRAKGASAADMEKTIRDAGKVLVGDVKNTQFAKQIDLAPLGAEVNKAHAAYRNATNPADRERFRKEYFAKWDAYNAARDSNEKLPRTRAKQIVDILAQYREIGATKEQLKKQFGRSTSKVRGTIEEALMCYPAEWVEKSVARGTIKPQVENRGRYNDWKKILSISGNGPHGFCTAIHELGHRLEHTIFEILDAEQAFYARRTKGETLESLRALTGLSYDATEMTRKDKFLDVYMGKDYGGRAFELVSMGFEMAFTDPEALLKDEDMAEWIFGLLAIS